MDLIEKKGLRGRRITARENERWGQSSGRRAKVVLRYVGCKGGSPFVLVHVYKMAIFLWPHERFLEPQYPPHCCERPLPSPLLFWCVKEGVGNMRVVWNEICRMSWSQAGVLGQRFSGDARANLFQPLSYPRDGPKDFDREARSLEGLAEVETSCK